MDLSEWDGDMAGMDGNSRKDKTAEIIRLGLEQGFSVFPNEQEGIKHYSVYRDFNTEDEVAFDLELDEGDDWIDL